jgi:hypothetical protein
MDVKVHLAVLARFKVLLAAGFVLALLLAIMAMAKIQFKGGAPSLAYRGHELWMSHETLLVTQTGAPFYRTNTGPRFSDTGRFSTLAALYARLANSDQVERLLLSHHRVPGGVSISASAITDSQVGPLPLVQITGMGTSQSAASAMANGAAAALRDDISAQQTADNIPDANRVLLTTVKRAGGTGQIQDALGGTTLVSGHSKLKPMAVFIGVFGLFVAIAYILENLRPRIRLVEPQARKKDRDDDQQRPAA